MPGKTTMITPFLPLCLALSAGIIGQHYFAIPPHYPLLLLLPIFLLTFYWQFSHPGRRRYMDYLLMILIFLSGIVRMGLWKETHLNVPYIKHLPITADTLTATLQDIQSDSRKLRAVLTHVRLKQDTLTTPIPGKLLLTLSEKHPSRSSLREGYSITLSRVQLEALRPPRNPGQFAHSHYLRQRGIVACGRIDDASTLQTRPQALPLRHTLFLTLRQRLEKQLDRYFPDIPNRFLKALLLGKSTHLPEAVREHFQQAGVIHVLAISGLHVGFISFIAYILLSFLPVYFKHRNLLLSGVLLFYMGFIGCHPPVVRATLMAVFYLLAIHFERLRTAPNYLFAAAFLMLLIHPQQLFWSSFQFSFAALLSIFYIYPKLAPLSKISSGRIPNQRLRFYLQYGILNPFFLSLSIQLGTIPLGLYYFQHLSLISFLMNILVIPCMGLLVGMGMLCLFVSFLSDGAGQLLANVLSLFIDYLLNAIQHTAALPFSHFHIPIFTLPALALYTFSLLLLLNISHARLRRLYAALLLITLIGLISIQTARTTRFNLLLLDVGEGDATLLRTPQSRTLLIDTGPATPFSNAADTAILPAMQHLGITTIHHLLISHLHKDHAGGLFRLIEQSRIDSVYLPPNGSGSRQQDTLRHVLQHAGIPFRYLKAGDCIEVDSQTRIYVLGPLQRLYQQHGIPESDLNNYSLVFLLRHRQQTLLFTGDIGKAAEALLGHWGNILKSDFLKIAHHGSRSSTSEDFLEWVEPHTAGISAGRVNPHGHPSPEVLQRLKRYAIRVFRTDQQQAVWLQLRNQRWEYIPWKKNFTSRPF